MVGSKGISIDLGVSFPHSLLGTSQSFVSCSVLFPLDGEPVTKEMFFQGSFYLCFWQQFLFCENKGIDGRATIGAFLLIDFNIF